jgi:hypothetical protein
MAVKTSWECDAGPCIFHSPWNNATHGFNHCFYCERPIKAIQVPYKTSTNTSGTYTSGTYTSWEHFKELTIEEWP